MFYLFNNVAFSSNYIHNYTRNRLCTYCKNLHNSPSGTVQKNQASRLKTNNKKYIK